jgi:hypothetical protein
MNESTKVSFAGVRQRPTGPGDWASRSLRGLNALDVRNVFYMQEDFWPISRIPRKEFDDLYRCFVSNRMDALRLAPVSELYRLQVVEPQEGHRRLYRFARDSAYLVSHQSSMWRKDFFVSCLKQGESPWENERRGTDRLKARKTEPRIYLADMVWYTGACRRGRLTRTGKLLLLKARATAAAERMKTLFLGPKLPARSP